MGRGFLQRPIIYSITYRYGYNEALWYIPQSLIINYVRIYLVYNTKSILFGSSYDGYIEILLVIAVKAATSCKYDTFGAPDCM